MKKILKYTTIAFTSLVTIGVVVGYAFYPKRPTMTPVTGTAAFEGSALLGVSDADIIATGYADGVLKRVEGKQDTLSVTPLPLNPQNPSVTELPAPNSVISWPLVLDVSPDGRFAYVVETRGTPPPEVEAYENVFLEFPEGNRLSVYDVSNPRNPKLIRTYEVPINPNTVMVSGDGLRLAMASDDTEGEIVIVDLENGLPVEIKSFNIDVPQDNYGRGGIRSLALHKNGKIVAGNINNQEIAFWRISNNEVGVATSITQMGQPILVGNHLAEIAFSKDGQHLITTDTKWSTRGNTPISFLLNPPGELASIRWSENGEHKITDRVTVGYSPEGFDISPQGDLIVTVDMNRSYLATFFPANIWARRDYSSLTLVAYDQETGTFKWLSEYHYEGILPEDAAFDKNGENVAIAIYHYGKGEDKLPENGYIGFWNVNRSGSQPRLKQTGYTIPVTRGLHDLVIIP